MGRCPSFASGFSNNSPFNSKVLPIQVVEIIGPQKILFFFIYVCRNVTAQHLRTILLRLHGGPGGLGPLLNVENLCRHLGIIL